MITTQRFLMIKVVWVDMFNYIRIFLITVFSLNVLLVCENPINSPLNKFEAETQKEKYFEDHRSKILINRTEEMEKNLIEIQDKKMKFDIQFFGNKPSKGWALYFSLHGGGGVPDSLNESQWNRHKTLYTIQDGILLVPRSPTNTWNMWHQDHIDMFFDRIIQNMIVFHNVDPNRIYLMGYSAGGDGVYQLAPRMADRFAAAAMMAGHPNETSPLGLRNIGFTIHMGENDSAYERNSVAIEWGKQLKILRENDKTGYSHLVKIHEGKGHWMGGLDSSAIPWISTFVRDPFPNKVIWKQDDVTHNRYYWLKVSDPVENSLLIANINKQTITIEKSTLTDFTIMINDHLVDMDKEVLVQYLGTEVFNGIVSRNTSVISNSIKEYGDPESVYFGEIAISLKPVK